MAALTTAPSFSVPKYSLTPSVNDPSAARVLRRRTLEPTTTKAAAASLGHRVAVAPGRGSVLHFDLDPMLLLPARPHINPHDSSASATAIVAVPNDSQATFVAASPLASTTTIALSSASASAFTLPTKTVLPPCASGLSIATMPPALSIPSTTSPADSNPQSPVARSATMTGWREQPPTQIARSLLHRSSRLIARRKSSARMPAPPMSTGADFVDQESARARDVQELSGRKRSRHTRGHSEGTGLARRLNISQPFNFQHLTHTAPSQAQILQEAQQDQLVTEFSCLRASQAPQPKLKGIQADDLPVARSRSSVILNSSNTSSPARSRVNSQTTKPDAATAESSASQAPPPPLPQPAATRTSSTTHRPAVLRAVHSVDDVPNLSTVNAQPQHATLAASTTSRLPGRLSLGAAPMTAAGQTFALPSSITHGKPKPNNHGASLPSPIVIPEAYTYGESEDSGSQPDIACAVSTPDDTAFVLVNRPLMSPTTDLADVPEELEVGDGRKAARRGGHRAQLSCSSTKRFSRPFINWSSQTSAEPATSLTEMREGNSVAPALRDNAPTARMSRRYSSTSPLQGGSSSWEDDVDYCYEHAMEAEGDGEWSSTPVHARAPGRSDTATPTRSSPWPDSPLAARVRPTVRTEGLGPYLGMPTLESDATNSGASSTVTMPGAVTPVDVHKSQAMYAPGSELTNAAMSGVWDSTTVLSGDETSRHPVDAGEHVSYLEAGPFRGKPFHWPDVSLDTHVRREISPPSSELSPLSHSTSRDTLLTSRPTSTSTIGALSRHRKSGSLGSNGVTESPINESSKMSATTPSGINTSGSGLANSYSTSAGNAASGTDMLVLKSMIPAPIAMGLDRSSMELADLPEEQCSPVSEMAPLPNLHATRVRGRAHSDSMGRRHLPGSASGAASGAANGTAHGTTHGIVSTRSPQLTQANTRRSASMLPSTGPNLSSAPTLNSSSVFKTVSNSSMSSEDTPVTSIHPPSPLNPARRVRASSSAASLTRPRSRASYSLFPAAKSSAMSRIERQ